MKIFITVTILLLLLIVFVFKCESKAVQTKHKYMIWLNQRIADLQKEYDETSGLFDDEDFRIKLTKGGKLKAYKEIRDYIKTH
jgi:uncharacterized protein (DUF927 family)